MENNNENKAKFFAQYWGQEIGNRTDDNGSVCMNKFTHASDTENCYLQLKPLSSISDEDAIEVSDIFSVFNSLLYEEKDLIQTKINDGKNILSSFGDETFDYYEMILCTDYLRSKCYALPWMGLSVEKQIEYGWIKLIN